jgi:putative methionine-R-sulfoxide reductase with GAF domain
MAMTHPYPPRVSGTRVRQFQSLVERRRDVLLAPDEELQAFVDAVARAMDAEVSTLYVYDASAERLLVAATQGLSRAAVGFIGLAVGEGISGRVAERRQPEAVRDVLESSVYTSVPGFDCSRYRSMLAVPIVVGGDLVGVLNIQGVSARDYSDLDVHDLCAIAEIVGRRLHELWTEGDLAVRLCGPSLLSSFRGIAAASLGAVEVCERLAAELRAAIPGTHVTVAVSGTEDRVRFLGDPPVEPTRHALADAMRGVGDAQLPAGLRIFELMGDRGRAGVLGVDRLGDGVDAPHVLRWIEAVVAEVGPALERLLAGPATPPAGASLHIELAEMVLGDCGVDAIMDRVTEEAGDAVAVVDAHGIPVAGELPPPGGLEIPLSFGDQRLGTLVAGPACDPSVVGHAAQAVALELMKARVRFDVEAKIRGDLLECVMGRGDARELQARAALVGLDLGRSYHPVMIAGSGGRDIDLGADSHVVQSLARCVARNVGDPPHSVCFARPNGLLVLVADTPFGVAGCRRAIDRALDEFRALAGPAVVGAGVGPVCASPDGYPLAIRHAEMLARFAIQRGGATGSVDGGALGLRWLMFSIAETDALQEFVDDYLGALLAYDERKGGQLVRTIEAMFLTGEHLSNAAALLFVHRNTLKYRLTRIEELTGRSVHLPMDRLGLYAALVGLSTLQPDRPSLLGMDPAAIAEVVGSDGARDIG